MFRNKQLIRKSMTNAPVSRVIQRPSRRVLKDSPKQLAISTPLVPLRRVLVRRFSWRLLNCPWKQDRKFNRLSGNYITNIFIDPRGFREIKFWRHVPVVRLRMKYTCQAWKQKSKCGTFKLSWFNSHYDETVKHSVWRKIILCDLSNSTRAFTMAKKV